ncbi:hypothetical protein QFC22_004930 [Naganishia vaughanmartiniae]|uniref:Uncharacterized protein n=1 Tax=Naganishia vaughanmartiniae TaxID=1424756 RepID=A0ACC2WY96_9TREE|nr:hypothetical protein QFC22_004930 [Naganishia vaughanmartiniae]
MVADSMFNQVDELIKKYKQACGFHDHTGQGVKSNEGQLAFTKQLHKICKYYDLFDESLGERSGFRSKKPFGNLGEMEQGWDECLGLKTVRAKKKKREDADEVEEGKQDGDGLVGDAAKAKKRQRLRASATNTSTGPINLLKPTEDPSATPNIPDTSVIEIKDDEEEGEDESREKRPSKSRGKGKGNPVMENLNDFLTTASEERKAQMQLARDMQAKKALRQDEKDKLRKMKEFRSLAPLIGSDVAWEQLFGQPLPSSKMQATQVASTSELAVVEAPKCDEAHQVDIPLDPSLSGNAVLYDPVGDAYHIGSTYGNVIGD